MVAAETRAVVTSVKARLEEHCHKDAERQRWRDASGAQSRVH